MLWVRRFARIIVPVDIRVFSLFVFRTSAAFVDMEAVESRTIFSLTLRQAADGCHDYRSSICIVKGSLSFDIRVFLTSSDHRIGNGIFFDLYHAPSHSSHYLMRTGTQIYIYIHGQSVCSIIR